MHCPNRLGLKLIRVSQKISFPCNLRNGALILPLRSQLDFRKKRSKRILSLLIIKVFEKKKKKHDASSDTMIRRSEKFMQFIQLL